MRLISVLIVGFALVLAGLVFFLVPRLMTRSAQEAQQQQPAQAPTSSVMVAAHTLPAGTVLKAEDVRWQRWPQDALDPNYLLQEKGADAQKDAVGRIVLHGFENGEPITAERLLKPGDTSFLAAELAPGMRAVSIRVDPVTDVSGFPLPQDRVDVLLTEHYVKQAPSATPATQNLPQVLEKDVTSVLLRNARVLGVDQTVQDLDSKPKIGTTVTLEVELAQAEKLAMAPLLGTLSLALRSHALPDVPETETDTALMQDSEVSPFRGKIEQQYFAILSAMQSQTGGGGGAGLHVYHGTALSAGAGQ
jgi:pilus assembly protein CpaB